MVTIFVFSVTEAGKSIAHGFTEYEARPISSGIELLYQLDRDGSRSQESKSRGLDRYMSKLSRSLRLRESGTNGIPLRASTTFLAKLRRSSGSTGSGNPARRDGSTLTTQTKRLSRSQVPKRRRREKVVSF